MLSIKLNSHVLCLLQVKYCSENNKRLIHFSTCEVYGKTIGAYLPKDSPLRQVMDCFHIFLFHLDYFFLSNVIGIEMYIYKYILFFTSACFVFNNWCSHSHVRPNISNVLGELCAQQCSFLIQYFYLKFLEIE